MAVLEDAAGARAQAVSPGHVIHRYGRVSIVASPEEGTAREAAELGDDLDEIERLGLAALGYPFGCGSSEGTFSTLAGGTCGLISAEVGVSDPVVSRLDGL